MNWEFLVVIAIVCATALVIILKVSTMVRRISSAKSDKAICPGNCSSCSFNEQIDHEEKR